MDDRVKADDNPFAEEAWQSDLAEVIREHELDQLSGIDSKDLAEHMAAVAHSLMKVVATRDRGMPEALSAVERAELAALRKVVSLQSVSIAVHECNIEDLNMRLADVQEQRDRALKSQRTDLARTDWADGQGTGWGGVARD